ncbi:MULTISPECIES: DUF3017 domain-containing protein [unclassified Streptomyces]|uniref:DUF3017 domain-containing protein n=1 Tax=unclassified Streptomyces TaxID=2593676 RepID=UPI0016566FCA|nr:DUF3017 domain-containing protein [Streptomyces sp. CB02980]MCB8904174.1 DUF3017 domain-containing protein [Streptomyces sp. CB02980]
MTPGTPGTAGTPDGAADGPSQNGSARASGSRASGSGAAAGGASNGGASTGGATAWKRPAPSLTTDTARPEGGGRAAPGDAPAPARQWPLLTVLGLAGLGLLVVGTDAFWQSFRIGTMLVGAALLVGAVLRRVLPSVGMLAVRSRFTDMITYGVMGGLIVLLALMVQPAPWLKIPFLEDVLHLTVT